MTSDSRRSGLKESEKSASEFQSSRCAEAQGGQKYLDRDPARELPVMPAVDTGGTKIVPRVPAKCMFDNCQAATPASRAIGLRYLFSESARKTTYGLLGALWCFTLMMKSRN